VTARPVRTCWCGGELGKEISRHYRSCNECGAAVLAVATAPGHFEVSDDERDFYGRRYWTDYSQARGLPDIRERARGDLSERCLYWLERLLEVVRPPGRTLEIGCGHGAFVRLMRELGFDATGTELSAWVVEFARRTFDVPVLRGRLETLALEPGFACIAAFDVLEHLDDPLGTARRCADLLAPDGVLLLQTPWYRGEGADWSMLQEDEHIHLFTEGSIRRLLTLAGFREARVDPSLFAYDMWVVATRGRLPVLGAANATDASQGWRPPAAFRALLDLSQKTRELRGGLASVEADRAARLGQVEELEGLLREAEADRAARLGQVEELEGLLQEAEADRAARLGQVEELEALLREAEADRAARLEQVEELTGQVQRMEEARREDVAKLTTLLRQSEADRAARLAQIHELSRLLRESEADRAARFEVIQSLEAKIADMERSWPWRLYRTLPPSLTGRKPGS
jgi:SAM-dependent methyltransferase